MSILLCLVFIYHYVILIMPTHKIQGLNSLRFIAFFWVFCSHAFPESNTLTNPDLLHKIISFGYLGIDIFFILSSFLLTYLGLAEKGKSQDFSIKNFLIRRGLRIYPLYYLVVASSFLILPLLSKLLNNDISLPRQPLYYIFFVSNYDNSQSIFALKFLWSIAIEEQYYIVWALCLFISRKNFTVVTISMFIIYIILFFLFPIFQVQVPDNSLFYLVNFAAGGFAAIFYYQFRKIITHLNLKLAFLLTIILALNFFATNNYLRQMLTSITIAIMMVLFISFSNLQLVQKSLFYRLFERLGVFTYGLYVYSGFILTVFVNKAFSLKLNLSAAPTFILEISLLLAVSILSYKLYESKFLILAKKFRKH